MFRYTKFSKIPTAALGTCQMRPHKHSQKPNVIEQHVAAVEFVVASLEGLVSPGGDKPSNEWPCMWVESIGVLGYRCLYWDGHWKLKWHQHYVTQCVQR